jgi:poly-gamma-glutamate capsule biosynthesis protein CapA/YwtB (metallophosphatase superfamily)
MRFAIILMLAFQFFPGFAQGRQGGGNTLRIVFAGDIMGHDSQIEAARVEAAARIDSAGSADVMAGYDYSRCFRNLKPYLREADIAVGNLEVTLGGPPYTGYPQFSSPDELGDALLDAGFDVLVNANNHALDRGKKGLERTVEVLGEKGMIQTGVFTSPGQRELTYPLILEKNGIEIALLNYTYGTNSLETDTPNIINYIDTMMIRHDIRKARLVDPDFIIACVHWGQEYEREENPTQQSLARFLFGQGVDAIIGSHPHVLQPIRFERDSTRIIRPVVYSLGNFISNQRDRYRNGGIVVGMDLQKTEDGSIAGGKSSTCITAIDYLPVYVHKPKQGDRNVFELVPCGIPEKMIPEFGFTDKDKADYLEFCDDTRKQLPNVPANGFYTR